MRAMEVRMACHDGVSQRLHARDIGSSLLQQEVSRVQSLRVRGDMLLIRLIASAQARERRDFAHSIRAGPRVRIAWMGGA